MSTSNIWKIWTVLVSAMAFVGSAYAADPIELAGVLVMPSGTKVSLRETKTGHSAWVAVGQGFAGYRISSYDSKIETVVLTKDGQELRLKLKTAKVKPGAASAEAPGGPSAPTAMAPTGPGGPNVPNHQANVHRAVMNNLRQLASAADQFYLENGKTSVTYDELVGPNKYIKQINPQDGENYRGLEFSQGKPLVVTTSSGITITYKN